MPVYKGSMLKKEAKDSWMLVLALLKTGSAVLEKIQFLWDYILKVIKGIILPTLTTLWGWYEGQMWNFKMYQKAHEIIVSTTLRHLLLVWLLLTLSQYAIYQFHVYD